MKIDKKKYRKLFDEIAELSNDRAVCLTMFLTFMNILIIFTGKEHAYNIMLGIVEVVKKAKEEAMEK